MLMNSYNTGENTVPLTILYQQDASVTSKIVFPGIKDNLAVASTGACRQ